VIRRLAIVGLGLLGGSAAKAARARGLAAEIVAMGRRREPLEAARRDGAVDHITGDVAEAVAGADLVLVATPVTTAEGLLPAVWAAADDRALITDVGSTKVAIVEAAARLGRTRPLGFVGSHPMAGSHQSGYGAARADLFQGATVVLTPTEHTPAAITERAEAFWVALGGTTTRLDPASHDRAVAAISHLPHLVADALVDTVIRTDPGALRLAAGGFRDTTRIAAAAPRMWREIFLDNRAALAETLAVLRKSLDHLEGLIAAGDGEALERELERIREVRERLG
jgi:prephenate dehydrogenase